MAIARRVKIRLVWQQLLTQDAPLKFAAVLDESVLRRGCGGPFGYARAPSAARG
jgi:hypothetical protein